MQHVVDALVRGDLARIRDVAFHRRCAEAIQGLERIIRRPSDHPLWLVRDPEDLDSGRFEHGAIGQKIWVPESDLGLIRKEATDTSDGKWYFHENCRLFDLLPPEIAWKEFNWLASLEAIRWEAERLMDEIMLYLSEHLRDPELWRRYHKSRHLHKLRLIRYDPATDKPVARGHYDRALATLHLADNFPGLFVERFEGDSQEIVPTLDGDVLAFLGYKAAIATGKRLRPLWHGGAKLPLGTVRWAFVYFVHTDHVMPTDWLATRRPASPTFGL